MTDAELLVGVWVMPGQEVRTAEFHGDGTMTYTIAVGERSLVMEMTWRIDGGMIVSDQPSAPSEVRSAYRLLDADTLVLEYDGETSTFRRS